VKEGSVELMLRGETGNVWTGLLQIPDRVEATLGCDGQQFSLLGAKDLGPVGAKFAKTALAVQGGMQAAKDVSGAVGEASNDFNSVRNGEMPASGSSHTSVEVGIGPGGVSSSTSRTTAGPGGIEHSATSSQIGPNGVSRTTANGRVDGNGATFDQRSRSLSIDLPGKGGTVKLTRTGPTGSPPAEQPAPAVVSAPPTPVPASAAPVQPPPAEPVEKPKQIDYALPADVTTAGVGLAFRGPLATEDLFKFNLKVTPPAETFVLVRHRQMALSVDGQNKPFTSDKVVVIAPDKPKGTTMLAAGDYREPTLTLVPTGLSAVPFTGTPLEAASTTPKSGALVEAGPATCTFTKVKGLTATLQCEATGPVLITPALATCAGAAARSEDGTHLLLAGDKQRVQLVLPSAGEVDWNHAFQTPLESPLEVAPLVLTARAD
jgi:hypothetical protein